MTTHLGTDYNALLNAGAIHTAREIEQQPAIWEQISAQIQREAPALRTFLTDALSAADRILLTGAGTSAFIGLSLRGEFQRSFGKPAQAVATTDLVTHPQDYMHKNIRTLIISFARSGNSPESVAALSLAEQFGGKCSHLIITCNGSGALAKFALSSRYVLVLPEEANDQGLAMTSSYTGMLLAGLLVARINTLDDAAAACARTITYGRYILDHCREEVKGLAGLPFRRAVFLGSGPLFGTAVEAHLKLQELTDGKIICTCDSFLGFRHGPKAVVDEYTLMVYFCSNTPYVLQYERDLLEDMRSGTRPMAELVVSERPVSVGKELTIVMPAADTPLDESFLPVCFIVVAQLLGYYKSMACGLHPDAPSSNGSITRVVQGVAIYASQADGRANGI